MGGRGGASGMTTIRNAKYYGDKYESLTKKATDYYNSVAKDALMPGSDKYNTYTDKQRQRIRTKWQNMGQQAMDAKRKYNDLQIQEARESNRGGNKTFVNGYGEATRREITTLSYERAQRRMKKDMDSRFKGR